MSGIQWKIRRPEKKQKIRTHKKEKIRSIESDAELTEMLGFPIEGMKSVIILTHFKGDLEDRKMIQIQFTEVKSGMFEMRSTVSGRTDAIDSGEEKISELEETVETINSQIQWEKKIIIMKKINRASVSENPIKWAHLCELRCPQEVR